MPPFYVKCKNKGCESVIRHNNMDQSEFEGWISHEGWVDNECPDCVASQGTEDSILQIPLPSGVFTASVPGQITQAEWRTIRDMIGVLSGCDEPKD